MASCCVGGGAMLRAGAGQVGGGCRGQGWRWGRGEERGGDVAPGVRRGEDSASGGEDGAGGGEDGDGDGKDDAEGGEEDGGGDTDAFSEADGKVVIISVVKLHEMLFILPFTWRMRGLLVMILSDRRSR